MTQSGTQMTNLPGLKSQTDGKSGPADMGWLDRDMFIQKQQQERAMSSKPPKPSPKISIKDMMNDPKKRLFLAYITQIGFSILTFLVIIILCAAINPPITQTGGNAWTAGTVDYTKVLLFAFVGFLVTFAVGEILRWVKF